MPFNNSLDDVLDVLSRIPQMHRSVQKDIFRGALENIGIGVSRHHLEILRVLQTEGTLHAAEIAEILLISKPQMTRLIDELIDLKLVERERDTQDRRKTNIYLTSRGRDTIERFHRHIKQNVRAKLAALNDEQLAELAVALQKIKDVTEKLSRISTYESSTSNSS